MIAPRQRNVALLVAACFFMQNLDGTIVTTAAKHIGTSLGVSALQVSLVITAYLVTFAVLIPPGGWLVSRLGARRVFLGAILVFTLASLSCALSTDLGMLVAMRVLQGAGAALMTPTGRIVALANVEKQDILRIMSFIIWPSLVAPVLAPFVGALITTYANWHWLFLINVPLGAVAFALGLRLMPASSPGGSDRLDFAGFAYSALGLGGLTYTAQLLSESTRAAVSASWGGCSAAFLLVAVRHLRRARQPLLDLDVFSIRTFRSANAGITLFTIVVGSVPFLLPLLFQEEFGWSAIKASGLVMCVFVGNIGIKPATTWILTTFGFRRVLAGSTTCVAGSMVGFGLLHASTPLVAIGALAVFSGAARSMGFTSYMSLTYADVQEADMRDANVLAATVQQLGAGLAIAAGAVGLHYGGSLARLAVAHPSSLAGYRAAFFLLALVALIACAMAAVLPADAGDAVRAGRRAEPEPAPALAVAPAVD